MRLGAMRTRPRRSDGMVQREFQKRVGYLLYRESDSYSMGFGYE